MTQTNLQRLTPKLVVDDADAAIAFYQEAFGALPRERYTVGETVVFARIEVFGGSVTLKDAGDGDRSATDLGGAGVVMEVATDDPDGLAGSAVAAGATVVFPVADQPYGARGGRVRDPFGHEWLLQTPVQLTADEVQRRLDAMAG